MSSDCQQPGETVSPAVAGLRRAAHYYLVFVPRAPTPAAPVLVIAVPRCSAGRSSWVCAVGCSSEGFKPARAGVVCFRRDLAAVLLSRLRLPAVAYTEGRVAGAIVVFCPMRWLGPTIKQGARVAGGSG